MLSDYVYDQGGTDARDKFEEMMQGAPGGGVGGRHDKQQLVLHDARRAQTELGTGDSLVVCTYNKRPGPGHGDPSQGAERADG